MRVENFPDQDEALDQGADGLGVHLTIGDACVFHTLRIESWEIAVLCEWDAALAEKQIGTSFVTLCVIATLRESLSQNSPCLAQGGPWGTRPLIDPPNIYCFVHPAR